MSRRGASIIPAIILSVFLLAMAVPIQSARASTPQFSITQESFSTRANPNTPTFCISSVNGYSGDVYYSWSSPPVLLPGYGEGTVSVYPGGPCQGVSYSPQLGYGPYCLAPNHTPLAPPGPEEEYLYASTDSYSQYFGFTYYCGGAILTLSPSTATNPVGTWHTVTVTASDYSTGLPVPGLAVSINITSGPNTGRSAWGYTDSSGHFSFTYHDTGGAGTDSVVSYGWPPEGACFNPYCYGVQTSNTVTKVWSGISTPEFGATSAAVAAVVFAALAIFIRHRNTH